MRIDEPLAKAAEAGRRIEAKQRACVELDERIAAVLAASDDLLKRIERLEEESK